MITDPLFLSIILTIILVLFYICIQNKIKFTIYTFIIIYILINLNNNYLFVEFTKKID